MAWRVGRRDEAQNEGVCRTQTRLGESQVLGRPRGQGAGVGECGVKDLRKGLMERGEGVAVLRRAPARDGGQGSGADALRSTGGTNGGMSTGSAATWLLSCELAAGAVSSSTAQAASRAAIYAPFHPGLRSAAVAASSGAISQCPAIWLLPEVPPVSLRALSRP